MNLTHNGKIGRLPKTIREELNRRLENGERQVLNHENYQTNPKVKFDFTNKSGPIPCVWTTVG
ncbi:MAG: hypothetical protein ABSE16_16305 [Verrucomicrobiota bacterium]|jgi:hypothetical protein